MPDSPVVDAHVHLVPGSELDDPQRDPYEIWEYGPKPDVRVLELPGTLDQATAAMHTARCDHFVVVNMFVPDLEVAKLDRERADGAGDRPSRPPPPASISERRDQLEPRLVDFNAWALEIARRRADLSVFVAADPSVLPGSAGAAHLRWAVERGARGIKLHTVLQRFAPDDPRMTAVFETCQELGVAVIAHAGASRGGNGYAEPDAFAPLLERHPGLKLVLAHLGGARWQQIGQLAAAFPDVRFDLCEIIAWTGAPAAPTADQLGRLIKELGPQRVLFGTDFPWYEVDRTIDQLMALPHLSDEERAGILGRNAVEYLGLPVPL